jgi:two-component system, LytTR family, response regulator
MIKTIIIDDEKHCIDSLSGLIEKNFSNIIELAGSFTSVEEGLQSFRLLKPQLVFLDVNIGNKSGFDFLRQLPEKNFDVIFTTAHEKFAVEAFRFSATDYLLKPVDFKELEEAIGKITQKKPREDSAMKLETLLENIEQLKQYTPPKKIIVPTINGFELLPVIDILRCQSDVNYTTIFMKDKKKLVVAKTLKEFEEMLGEYNFFRVHNSHLVNLAYIKRYNKGKGGSVIMSDDSEIEVSSRRKDEFLKKIASV